MQSAIASVEGTKEIKVSMPDQAEFTGSADTEKVIAAIQKSGKFKAVAQ